MVFFIQDITQNCIPFVTANTYCGGYRGQVDHTCRTFTLSVTVTAAINGSEVKCYNADRSVIGETDPIQPVGSASIWLVPAIQIGWYKTALWH